MKPKWQPPLRSRTLARLTNGKPHTQGPISGRCARCGGGWPCLITAMATDVLARVR